MKRIKVHKELLRSLVDEEECRFDHHGNCQAHGYMLEPGERCPQDELKIILGITE